MLAESTTEFTMRCSVRYAAAISGDRDSGSGRLAPHRDLVRLDVAEGGRAVFAVRTGERVLHRQAFQRRKNEPTRQSTFQTWAAAWTASRAAARHLLGRDDFDDLRRDPRHPILLDRVNIRLDRQLQRRLLLG